MWTLSQDHPLRKHFAGVTEHAFLAKLGIADTALVDYIADMLSRFVHVDAIFKLRDAEGRTMGELVDMAMEAEQLPPEGRTVFEYHRHIGDFALYWSGLFPEQVNRLQARLCKDHLINFAVLGKRSYRLASQFQATRDSHDAQVLQHVSDEFEVCAVGLNEVRKEWKDLAQQPGGGEFRIIR